MGAYATTEEAQTYFNSRLNTDPWDNAIATEKTKALAMSTSIIDRLNFRGEKTSADQELQFPRGEDTVVPQDIKNACAEIALSLLDGVDPEMEFESLKMKSQVYGVIRSTYDSERAPEHTVAGVPSSIAWRFLKPYLRNAQTVDLHRVS